jgi:hypothetical protein
MSGYNYGELSDIKPDMSKEFVFQKIEKNIYIYKNLIPNAKRFVELLKLSEEDPDSSYFFKDWGKWSIFGTYIVYNGKGLPENAFEENSERFREEKHYLDLITTAFYESTEHFLKDHEMMYEKNWQIMGPSICRYDYDTDWVQNGDEDLTMTYHTDYKYLEADSPGPKFALTSTMYLNDKYDGGGLVFVLPNKQVIEYKPEAGDIVVFPSGHPDLLSEDGLYFHGVRKIRNAPKYMVRCFYQIPSEGTPEWFENQEKYGEEVWAEMERKRIEEQSTKSNIAKILGWDKENPNDN